MVYASVWTLIGNRVPGTIMFAGAKKDKYHTCIFKLPYVLSDLF